MQSFVRPDRPIMRQGNSYSSDIGKISYMMMTSYITCLYIIGPII